MKEKSSHFSWSIPLRMLALALAAMLAVVVGVASPPAAKADTLSVDNTASALASGPQSTKASSVHYIRTATEFRNISRYNGGTFKIAKNITLPNESYYLSISKNKKYVIDLNGHTVKTAYSGVALRTVYPIWVKAGTVVIKTSNKQDKGVLYSTETVAILAEGNSKLYLTSGSIVNDAVEFRSDITSAVMLNENAKCYLQGKTKIQSIGNGIAMMGSSRLYATGSPWVRAGANTYTGQFTHYGSGISIASRNARVVLKGGSYGTKASPDAVSSGWGIVPDFTMAQSANYPILDQFGYALEPNKTLKTAIPSGYKVLDAKGQEVKIRGDNLSDYYTGLNGMPSWTELIGQYGYKSIQRYTTTVKDVNGYYAVYIKPAKSTAVSAAAVGKIKKVKTGKNKVPQASSKTMETIAKPKAKTMTVKWKGISSATDYIVGYKSSKSKKWSYVFTGGKTYHTFGGMKVGDLMEFRVAVYDGKKKARSEWTKINCRFYREMVSLKATAGTGKIALKWGKVAGATGYQILISSKKDMSGAKVITVKGGSTLKKTLTTLNGKKLTKGKTYYVKMRAIKAAKNANGKKNTYIGIHSLARTCKIK